MSGQPVTVQCTVVPYEFEGHTFSRMVAVANKALVRARQLFLGDVTDTVRPA